MRVGEHLGVMEPAACDGSARCLIQCHGSAGTPLRTHAGTEALGLQDARTAIRT
jgi:hypothetical protein